MKRGLEHALDEYLVLLAQGGSREAFERLALRWTPRLAAHLARSLGSAEAAKDVVQETWLGAVRSLHTLDDPARFQAWLYAIAGRKCADALRGKYRRVRLEAEAAQRAALERAANARESDRGAVLADALKQLPQEQAIAASLYFGEGMSVAEIAHATGARQGTVKSRLFAARKALRAAFGEG